MLIELKIRNFRSFRNETLFTMKASQQKTHSNYIFQKNIGKKTIRILPVSVIYGANASGKSNIIKAMDLLKKIVLSGDLKNKEINYILKHSPFIHDESYFQPSSLEVEFLNENRIINFELEYNITGEIINESLTVNGKNIYLRKNNSIVFKADNATAEGILDNVNMDYLNSMIDTASDNQDNSQLFFTNGFKVLFGKSLYNDVIKWFNNWNIISDINDMQIDKKEFTNFNLHSREDSNETLLQSIAVNEVMEKAEFGTQKIRFRVNSDSDDIEIQSLYKLKDSNSNFLNIRLDSEMMESKGTLQLLKLVAPFVKTLKTGGTIVLDEMDSSMHFEIGVSLIHIFNNKTINKKGAQLIFNTHNPIYLDGTLLRHDQMVMVEKNPTSLISEIYSLDEYKLRPEERILKNYLNGKYGALPKMDLESAFRNILMEEDCIE